MSVSDLRSRYAALRALLDRNGSLLEMMADLELDLRMLVPGDPLVWARIRRLLDSSLLQAQTLNVLSGRRHRGLYRAHEELEQAIWQHLRRLYEDCRNAPLTVPLKEATREDAAVVGGKAARLGELAARYADRVPEGFVAPTAAYSRFLAHGGTGERLREILKDLDVTTDRTRFWSRVERARELILAQSVPEPIGEAIRQAASRLQQPAGRGWAVRSSAVGEDGPNSFAGQFETLLDVPETRLVEAWREVVASAFSQRALSFRIACGLTELATPMAVLFMPMVDADWAGVACTRDPSGVGDESILSLVRGLGSGLVTGVDEGLTCRVSRTEPGRVLGSVGSTNGLDDERPSESQLAEIVGLGEAAEEHFAEPLEIEWAMDGAGRPFLLQARPLASMGSDPDEAAAAGPVLLEGGTPIVVGHAVGPVRILDAWSEPEDVPQGSILVIPHATPDFGHLLPRVEGLIAEHGSFAGHLASLAREFGVPTVFGMAGARARLPEGEQVSLDARVRRVHAGDAWPGAPTTRRRLVRQGQEVADDTLRDRVQRLSLTDPRAPGFRPANCRSVHDIVRFCHERGIAALFEPGAGEGPGEHRGVRRLLAPKLPNQIWVLDTGGGVEGPPQRDVEPEQVTSRPFQALWRGMNAPGIEWRGRRVTSLKGFASVVSSSLLEPAADPGRLASDGYLVVDAHYLSLNARLAYHFAIVEAQVGAVSESNFVRFRFWGGGAALNQRDLRAVFLGGVLQAAGFSVERRGDLVTARLRRQPGEASGRALETLGKLMGCARQLDMLMGSSIPVEHYVERFLAGDYETFA